MSRFRSRTKTAPERSFADNVTRRVIRPAQAVASGNASESRTTIPNPETIYLIPAAPRPELDALRPAWGRCYSVRAGA